MEGPTDDPVILELRARQMRNILATLFLSQGTPMISHGDEVGRTQLGNNNVYCQDSELSWMDWSLCERNADLLTFVRTVTGLRRQHPVFRRRRFFDGKPTSTGDQGRDIAWLTRSGMEMTPEDWVSGFGKSVVVFLNGEAIVEPNQRGERVLDDSFLLCFNRFEDELEFVIPDAYAQEWTGVLDTAEPTGATTLVTKAGAQITLPGRSLLVLRKTA